MLWTNIINASYNQLLENLVQIVGLILSSKSHPTFIPKIYALQFIRI